PLGPSECATLLVALWTSRVERVRGWGAALILLTIAIAVTQILADSNALTAITGTFSGLLVVAIGVVIVRGVISEGTGSQRSVTGAICVYFLLGMLFQFVYSDIAALGSEPFFAQGTDGT